MESELYALVQSLSQNPPQKDGLDIFSLLSVPILSLAALIITTIFAIKQWCLMKYEYRLKLYPEKFEIYNYLINLFFELKTIDKIPVEKYRLSIQKIENKIFIYNQDINNKYQEFINWMNSFDTSDPAFNSQQYTEQFKTRLLELIDIIKKNILKYHLGII